MEYTKEKIRELLTEMAEPDYAKFSGSLLGREAVMLGVRLPKIRDLAKKIARADGREYLERTLSDIYETDGKCGIRTEDVKGGISAEDAKSRISVKDVKSGTAAENAEGWTTEDIKEPVSAMPAEEIQYMEELMLYGMVIGCMKEKLEILFPYIRRYIARIDNWSLCDSFCAGLKQTKKEPELMWDFLQPYLRSDREFDLRFGVVMLMDFYVTPEYIDDLLKIYDGIRHEGYYSKMAVAWALSVCLIKQWDKSYAYMSSADNHLDEFTYVKTVQKCRESFRLSEEQKALLRELKEKRVGGRRTPEF